MLCLLCGFLLGQGGDPPARLSETEEAALRATVRIYNSAKDLGGTAVAIGRVGPAVYLLTSAHVVEGADRVEAHVFVNNGDKMHKKLADVAVVGKTGKLEQDLALLRIAAAGDDFAKPVRLAKTAKLGPKMPCTAFSTGCTEFLRPSVQPETILDAALVRKTGANEAARFWKCKAAPVEGRSGGPLLLPDGSLVGICSGGDGKVSYYTHVDEIRRFLKSQGLHFLAD